MSEKKIKKKNIILIVLIVVLLVGACFATVTIYAKKQLSKPVFTMPDQAPVQSVTELPKDKEEICAYVNRLYEQAATADDVEGSFSTNVNLDEDIEANLKEADLSLLNFIRNGASSGISGFYTSASNVVMSKAEDFPQLEISPEAVSECTAQQGHTDESGNVTDDTFYFITLVIDPDSIDTSSFAESDIFKKIEETVAPSAKLENVEITAESRTVDIRIDRATDRILSVDTASVYSVKANTVFTDDYKALASGDEVEAAMHYKTNEHISFSYYGVKFNQPAIAVKKGDMKALPASVTVNSDATKDDYKLTFTPSEKSAVSIDNDGVMTVLENGEKEITVKMTLVYDGHTYSDQMTVYITEMEVATDG
ncbi:MAG: hypothetical protein IK063_07165 [Clostridia bacterium]|nr:hypothetical protein [Clostridia bacterium]